MFHNVQESEADSDSTQPAADNNYQNLADF